MVSTERRALAMEHVALLAVRVDLPAQQVSLIWRTERSAAIAYQAGRRDASKLGHHRHPIAGALQFVSGGVRLRINATLDEVQQRVALAVFGIAEVSHGADGLARRCKHDL